MYSLPKRSQSHHGDHLGDLIHHLRERTHVICERMRTEGGRWSERRREGPVESQWGRCRETPNERSGEGHPAEDRGEGTLGGNSLVWLVEQRTSGIRAESDVRVLLMLYDGVTRGPVPPNTGVEHHIGWHVLAPVLSQQTGWC
jgi:hypothetical protein